MMIVPRAKNDVPIRVSLDARDIAPIAGDAKYGFPC